MTGICRRAAGRLSSVGAMPTAVRALLKHYADAGVLARGAVDVQRTVEDEIERRIDDTFATAERAIAEEFGVAVDEVGFDYGTKLTMPVELTLGQVYYRARRDAPGCYDPVTDSVDRSPLDYTRLPFDRDGERQRTEVLRERAQPQRSELERARAITDLVLVALLDGDMRDAINDDEFEDFEVEFDIGDDDRRRIAEVVQSALQEEVEAGFDTFDDGVREAYEHAVEISEAHQDDDPHFRELMERAEAGEEGALNAIEEEYKFAAFEDQPAVFEDLEEELPYLETQYGRVGVIYDGMIDMYREAGVEIDPAFERAIVLAIVGAQVWLDDVDDYERDLADGQLTPVTAEYLLADDDAEAYKAVLDVSMRYLDAARKYAARADSPLVGIGVDYIELSGDPSVLSR